MFFKQRFDTDSSTYTYLIADDTTHEAVIIDPVFEQVERDLKLIHEHGLKLKYTLETHVQAEQYTSPREAHRICRRLSGPVSLTIFLTHENPAGRR